MRLTMHDINTDEGVDVMSLNWESLGRYVQVHTLEAVAMHFAAMAEQGGATLPTNRTDRKAVTE